MEGGRTVEGEEGKAVEMDEEGDEELMAVEKRVRVKIRVKKAMKKKTQRRWEDAVVLWLIDGWRRMSLPFCCCSHGPTLDAEKGRLMEK